MSVQTTPTAKADAGGKNENRAVQVARGLVAFVNWFLHFILYAAIAFGILLGGFGLFTQAGWHVYLPTDSEGCLKAIVVTDATANNDHTMVFYADKVGERDQNYRPIHLCR